MNTRELEEALCRLPSVDAVRIVGDEGNITEVHVVAPLGKAPKQVVRDIQSLAMARFGTNIDRRAVSVVQIAPERSPADLGGDRPSIADIAEDSDGERVQVKIVLAWHESEFSGSSTGPSAASARLRLVGEATLRALEEVLGGNPPLALDSIGHQSVGGRDIMTAVVVSTDGKSEEVLVGTSINRGETSEAAVRAVLDALNRRIPQLLR